MRRIGAHPRKMTDIVIYQGALLHGDCLERRYFFTLGSFASMSESERNYSQVVSNANFLLAMVEKTKRGREKDVFFLVIDIVPEVYVSYVCRPALLYRKHSHFVTVSHSI